MSRKNRATSSPQAATVPQLQGPKRQRPAATEPQQLDGDACREAIYFVVHSPDEARVFEKMKLALHRQDLVHDAEICRRLQNISQFFRCQRTSEL